MVPSSDSANRAAWRWRALSAAGAVAVVAVYAVGIGAPLSNYDEPLYAEMVRAMHRSGDYLTLSYQGGETLQRPPTSVALYAMVARVVGGEVGLRLAPALLSALAALLAGWAAGRVFRDRWAPFIAAAVAAGAPSMYLYGRLLLSDPPFVVACVLAVYATARAQTEASALRWAAVWLGAGFLFKSMAAAIPVVALAPWWIAAARRHGRRGRALAGDLAWFAGLAALYYVVGFAAYGGRFWDEHVGLMLVDRAGGDMSPLIGIGGPLAYAEHVVAGDGVLYAVVFGGVAVGAAVWAAVARDRELGVVATYTLGCFALLSLVSTRLPHYLLVVYPGVGLCAAGLAARAAPRSKQSERSWRQLFAVAAVAVFASGIARDHFDAGAYPSGRSKQLGEAARAAAAPGQRVYTLDWYSPAFGYYADRPFSMLSTVPAVAEALAGADPFLQAANVAAVPPWPEGPFLVAAPQEAMVRAITNTRLDIERVVVPTDDVSLYLVMDRP